MYKGLVHAREAVDAESAGGVAELAGAHAGRGARDPRRAAVAEADPAAGAVAVDVARHASRARAAVSYTHLRAHETGLDIVCRLLLEKKKQQQERGT